jgi:hypothetical protein
MISMLLLAVEYKITLLFITPSLAATSASWFESSPAPEFSMNSWLGKSLCENLVV